MGCVASEKRMCIGKKISGKKRGGAKKEGCGAKVENISQLS
jgi:hypothetical protein